MVAKRQNVLLLHERQLRNVLPDLRNDLFVLLRFETARAVNQNAVSLQEWRTISQDRDLLPGHTPEIVWRQPPANVDPPTHHSSIAARRIDQNPIEWRQRCYFVRRLVTNPVAAKSTRDLHAQLGQVLIEPGHPFHVE